MNFYPTPPPSTQPEVLQHWFYCIHCGTPCHIHCFPNHQNEFSCHNALCIGHAPLFVVQRDHQSSFNHSSILNTPQYTPQSKYGQVDPETRVSTPSPMPKERACPAGTLHWTELSRPGAKRVARSQVPLATPRRPVQPQHFDADEIIPGLFVGSIKCLLDDRFIQEKGITSIISVLTSPLSDDGDAPIKKIPLQERFQIQIKDSKKEDIVQHFPGASDWIDRRLRSYLYMTSYEIDARDRNQERPALPGQSKLQLMITQPPKKRILIHCRAGVSRSASIAIAYLMWRRRQDFQDVLSAVRDRRPRIWPNSGFRDQLRLWYKTGFQLYQNPEYKVPCEEYAYYLMTLRLRRLEV